MIEAYRSARTFERRPELQRIPAKFTPGYVKLSDSGVCPVTRSGLPVSSCRHDQGDDPADRGRDPPEPVPHVLTSPRWGVHATGIGQTGDRLEGFVRSLRRASPRASGADAVRRCSVARNDPSPHARVVRDRPRLSDRRPSIEPVPPSRPVAGHGRRGAGIAGDPGRRLRPGDHVRPVPRVVRATAGIRRPERPGSRLLVGRDRAGHEPHGDRGEPRDAGVPERRPGRRSTGQDRPARFRARPGPPSGRPRRPPPSRWPT